MKTFRLGEDIPLEAKSVTTTLNQVQMNVEDYFSEIRGQLLEYDEILATQRETIYQKRANILMADTESTQSLLGEWSSSTMEDLVRGSQKGDKVDLESLHTKATQFFGSHFALSAADLANLDAEGKLKQELLVAAENASRSKLAALEAKRAGLAVQVWRYLCLVQTDLVWSKHLVMMNGLKETVQMRKYEGRDPLNEYQAEGVTLFQQLLDTIRRDSIYSFFAYSP